MKKLLALLLALAMVSIACFALAEEIAEEPSSSWWEEVYNDDGTQIGWDYLLDGSVIYTERYKFDSDGNYAGYEGREQPSNKLSYKYVDDSETGIRQSCSYDQNGSPTTVNIWGPMDEGYSDVYFDANGHVIGGYVDTDTGYVWYDSEEGKWVDGYTGEDADAPDLSGVSDLFKNASGLMGAAATTYTNNTVCVAGTPLKTLNPDLTDKWYTVVPVDLSQDGTQVFPLVASNKYLIGSVKVTVAGDEVTTTYSYPSYFTFHIFPGDECLAWFTGVDQITSEFLDAPASETAFGTAVSKANDLNGQDTALLFVCNRLTYRIPLSNQGAMPREYHPNTPGMAGYFDNATALLEKLGN